MNLSDSRYCKALLGIAHAYPGGVYILTSAVSVSAELLGPKKLPIHSLASDALNETLEPEAEVLIKHAATAWEKMAKVCIFGGEPFPHIYALLFFLEVLAVDRKLLYRGQFDARWGLKSTLQRGLEEGLDPNAINEAKRQYTDQVHQLPDKKHLNLVQPEIEALCQHYGLPTCYLDFTYSATIAAFFALGGEARYRMPGISPPERGAIWVIDAMGEPSDAIELVTLPDQVMRPWLQQAEFLDSKALMATNNPPKIAKFTFLHHPEIWVEELYNLGPYSSMPLSMYLFPRRDLLEETVGPIRSNLAETGKKRAKL